MPHVVTQACCGDASCVYACPVNCIHPTPDEADFGMAEMLYIDPDTCVDCGACVSACPVGAISPHTRLDEDDLPFVDINAAFHADGRSYPSQAPVPPVVRLAPDAMPLRVAVVGAGPAALYAADELLKQPGVEVTLIDRLPTPYGLVRAGVAPDHQDTKSIEVLFGRIEDQPGFRYLLGVEVGEHVTHAELTGHHHAVVYATGASRDRRLDIAGEDLPGSDTATHFVAWYNGHPDHVGRTFDLSHRRAVVVGNGNVALDVARVLTTDPDRLATTDIAAHALAALRDSAVREVVVLGRRGPREAAFTLPELTGLLSCDDIDVRVDDPAGLSLDGITDRTVEQKILALRAAADRTPRPGARRIILRFATSPVQIVGTDRVEGVRVVHNELVADATGGVRAVATGEASTVSAGLALRSIGYRGTPVADLPFDEAAAVVPNAEGRVIDAGAAVPGTYVVGWIKRGPTGFIGTNKSCSRETVNHLLADANRGRLPDPPGGPREFAHLVRSRQPRAVDRDGWHTIDSVERERGLAAGRVRSKLTTVEEMLDVAADRHVGGRRRVRGRVPWTSRIGGDRTTLEGPQ